MTDAEIDEAFHPALDANVQPIHKPTPKPYSVCISAAGTGCYRDMSITELNHAVHKASLAAAVNLAWPPIASSADE